MDWRAFQEHGDDRGGAFYETALLYAQYLWMRGFAARALLCLDRAMGADLRGDETILKTWPMPYLAMGWVIASTPEGVFIGNPRVHFQHYADRMNQPRRDIRRWRAWGCWALTRRVRPDLPGDLRHVVEEPTLTRIGENLRAYGLPGEEESWRTVLDALRPAHRDR